MAQMTGAAITGLGAYRPSRLITNEEIAEEAGVTPEWIEERTGIRSRYRSGPEESVTMMAAEASGKALAMANVDPADVDLVILASATKKDRIPGGAPEVASRIGITATGAFDLNAACAGFAYSIGIAANEIRMGSARNVLVVGAEQLSRFIDPEDPATYVIFGDGAGAAVVSPAEVDGISPTVWGSDGSRSDILGTKWDANGREFAKMDGPLVYRWSTKNVPRVAARCAPLPASSSRTLTGSCRTRRTSASSTSWPRSSRSRTRRSPRTSSTPATPQPRRCRWRSAGCTRAVRLPPATA